MSKFEVKYTDDAIVFINNKTAKSDKLLLLDRMDGGDAVKALEKENTARESASRASVSLLAEMLNNPRFDAYKGATPLTSNIPKELKEAAREMESEFLKPLFVKAHEDKGQTPATIAKKWDEYIGSLRAGSSYAVAKGKVLAYFAYLGKLPITDSGKLLTVPAIDKLMQIARENIEKVETGIADKLVKLSEEISNKKESTKLGDPATALAALRAMIAQYEQVQQANAEAAQRIHEAKTTGHVNAPDDVAKQGKAVVSKARRVKKEEAPAPM